MPTDRAQDTEAIRAARKWDGTSHDPISTEQAHEVAANWRDTTQLANALDAMADEADRLMARLEAAEQALAFYADPLTYFGVGIAGDEPTGGFMEDIDEVPWPDGGTNWKPGKRARAALAAAAPGECDGSPTCAASEHVENCVAGWATGAAPGETGQTP